MRTALRRQNRRAAWRRRHSAAFEGAQKALVLVTDDGGLGAATREATRVPPGERSDGRLISIEAGLIDRGGCPLLTGAEGSVRDAELAHVGNTAVRIAIAGLGRRGGDVHAFAGIAGTAFADAGASTCPRSAGASGRSRPAGASGRSRSTRTSTRSGATRPAGGAGATRPASSPARRLDDLSTTGDHGRDGKRHKEGRGAPEAA
jgi:hypothetical protein